MSFVTLEDAEVIKCTEKAILVKQDGVETWIPRSVCADGAALDIHDTDIEVREWFADQEGLNH